MMSILLLDNEKIYYSHRLDNLIVSYLIQNYLLKYPKIDITVIEAIIQYIRDMQHTHYSGDALFRVIQAVEQVHRIGLKKLIIVETNVVRSWRWKT